jgi:hypothetical protein
LLHSSTTPFLKDVMSRDLASKAHAILGNSEGSLPCSPGSPATGLRRWGRSHPGSVR